jgi:PPOX class probable F420-dependent enzyme
MATFDPKSESHQAIAKRLADDEVAWLTTVHGDAPRPVPVWFLWDGDQQVLVYSNPKALKVNTARENPHASLHFNSDEHGGQIAIVDGELRLEESGASMIENEPYVRKYRAAMDTYHEEMKTTDQALSDEFSVRMILRITGARGW